MDYRTEQIKHFLVNEIVSKCPEWQGVNIRGHREEFVLTGVGLKFCKILTFFSLGFPPGLPPGLI